MSYSEEHTDEHCDKCLKKVGKANLSPVSFHYLDRNDNIHPDATDWMGRPGHKDFKQYYICQYCFKKRQE